MKYHPDESAKRREVQLKAIKVLILSCIFNMLFEYRSNIELPFVLASSGRVHGPVRAEIHGEFDG